MQGSAGKQDKPQWRNIHVTDIVRYHLPMAGIVSILHRISGLLLCIGLGFVIHTLDISLSSPEGFAKAVSWWHCPLVKVIAIIALWSLFHHLWAGIRFLLLDCHCGLSKPASRSSAIVVFVLSLVCTIIAGVVLW